MTRTPSDSPTELAARTAVLERVAHTALAQLDASSRPDDDSVRLAAEVLKRALRPDSARSAPPLACFWLQEPDGSRWLVPGCMDRMHRRRHRRLYLPPPRLPPGRRREAPPPEGAFGTPVRALINPALRPHDWPRPHLSGGQPRYRPVRPPPTENRWPVVANRSWT